MALTKEVCCEKIELSYHQKIKACIRMQIWIQRTYKKNSFLRLKLLLHPLIWDRAKEPGLLKAQSAFFFA